MPLTLAMTPVSESWSLIWRRHQCMCPGGNTNNNTSDNTVDANIDSTTGETVHNIADINCNNSGDDTGGNTCNVTGVDTDSNNWKVPGDDKDDHTDRDSCCLIGNSPGGAICGGVGSGSGNDFYGDNFEDTGSSVITAALVTKHMMTLNKLLARSLATTRATSLAVTLAVQQTFGSLASAATRLHRCELTSENVIFHATTST